MDTRNNWQIGPGHSCHYTLLSYWHRMDDTKLVTVILWIHNYHINTPSSETICDQLYLANCKSRKDTLWKMKICSKFYQVYFVLLQLSQFSRLLVLFYSSKAPKLEDELDQANGVTIVTENVKVIFTWISPIVLSGQTVRFL